MATPTIPNGEEHFFNILYEGNGAGRRVGNFVPFTDSGVISNSCIFNGTTNNYLARTPSSNGSGTTLTFSCWVKRGLLGYRDILYNGNITSNSEHLHFDASNKLNYYEVTSGSRKWNYVTTRTFEDTSKWYHIYVRRDTTDSTAADRIQIYVDGERITAYDTETQPALNATGYWNQTTYGHYIGTSGSASYIRGIGYLAEINMVDGSNPAISTFGLTDTSTGRWIPKSLTGITYGTNGFRLQFGSPSAIGDDTSGNNNDWSVNDLVASDLTTDSPTQNFATGLGAFQTSYAMTMSEGNLKSKATGASGQHGKSQTTLSFDPSDSDGYYAEYTVNETSSVGSNFNTVGIGAESQKYVVPSSGNGAFNLMVAYKEDGRVRFTNGGGTSTDIASWGSTWGNVSTPDIIGIFVKNNKIYFHKNGTYQNSADPNNETGGLDIEGTIGSNRVGFFHVGYQSASTGGTMTANFGQKSFTYTPPTGYKKLNQDNLPETSKGISGFVWMKNRDATDNHQLYDSSRGKQKAIFSNTTDVQATVADGLQKFLVGGQQIEDDVSINTSGESYVSWNWNANAGTTASNGNGSITSTVQANTTAGFSIVRYTGTGSAATVGHGLSSAPEWIFGRPETLSGGYHWSAYHKSMTSASYYLSLNQNIGETSNSDVWGSAPTSSIINLGVSMSNSSQPIILYCWHSVDGFSKFGKYTGNGVADGPFVYTGFKPAWLLVKANNAANWYLCDAARSTMNPVTTFVHPDRSDADYSNFGRGFDFLSNGFKVRQESGYGANYSGVVTFYMAFAKHPFVGDGTNPVTAR